MLSDDAPWVCKALINLKMFFPNLIHTIFLAHGINRVFEEIRNQFLLVDELISNIFFKRHCEFTTVKNHLPIYCYLHSQYLRVRG